MDVRRNAVVLVALVALTTGSVYTLDLVGPPTVSAVDNQFVGADDRETLIRTNVTIHNPNPIDFGSDDVTVSYSVQLGAVTFATGRSRGISIGSGNQTLSYLTTASNERIPEWWARHVQNGERSTLLVTVEVRVPTVDRSVSTTRVERPIETNVLSSFNSTETREVHADLPFVTDPVLYVNETAAWWGAVTEAESPIVTRLTVYNPKPVPYVVTSIGYDVTMNGVQMGEGTIDRNYVVEARSTTTVDATTTFENDRLGEWWSTHLENGERTELRIDYYAIVELPTGDEVRISLEEMAHEGSFETDVFRNNETAE